MGPLTLAACKRLSPFYACNTATGESSCSHAQATTGHASFDSGGLTGLGFRPELDDDLRKEGRKAMSGQAAVLTGWPDQLVRNVPGRR